MNIDQRTFFFFCFYNNERIVLKYEHHLLHSMTPVLVFYGYGWSLR